MRLAAAFLAGVGVGILGMLAWSLYVALHAGGTVPDVDPRERDWAEFGVAPVHRA